MNDKAYIHNIVYKFEQICFIDKNMADQFLYKLGYATKLTLLSKGFKEEHRIEAINNLCEILDNYLVKYVKVNRLSVTIDVMSLLNVDWLETDLFKSINIVQKFNL